MSIEENKRVVKKFLALLADPASDEAFKLLTADATWWLPTDQPGGMTLPAAQMRGMIPGFFAIFAQLPVMEQARMTAEEDRVCVEQTARGGITRGGLSYANDYHLLFRLRDGLIVEVREYMNPLMIAGVTAEMAAAAK